MDFSARRFIFIFSVLCKIKAATALLAVDCWLLLCCTHWWRGSISLMQWKRRNVNWILCTLILTTPTLSCCTQLFCIHPRLSLFFFFFPLARWLDGMELAGIEKNMFRVQDLWIFKLRSFSGIRRRKWSYILWNFLLRLTFYGPQKYLFDGFSGVEKSFCVIIGKPHKTNSPFDLFLLITLQLIEPLSSTRPTRAIHSPSSSNPIYFPLHCSFIFPFTFHSIVYAVLVGSRLSLGYLWISDTPWASIYFHYFSLCLVQHPTFFPLSSPQFSSLIVVLVVCCFYFHVFSSLLLWSARRRWLREHLAKTAQTLTLLSYL